jgi:NAD(P)-dependent dehydrogenase (short-subunit alcohol dehydrogenase family)
LRLFASNTSRAASKPRTRKKPTSSDPASHRPPRAEKSKASRAAAHKPTGGNAAYATAKAAAEAWTLALGDAFRKSGGESGPQAAAVILVVKALVHDAMRAQKPDAKFPGFTDVGDLAEAIAGVWDKPAPEVNGQRVWLTPQP